jgi:hypothetical protein
MTTYNTGNPIGSTDARDRSDNSENLDVAVNSLALTFKDRLGRTRDTLEGVYQKSAYYRAGTFDAGYTLTNNRQTLAYGNIEYSWSGAFPKVIAAGSTPETTGGIGAGAWVDRTQDGLREEITAGELITSSMIIGNVFASVDAYSVLGMSDTDAIDAAMAASNSVLFGARKYTYTKPLVSVGHDLVGVVSEAFSNSGTVIEFDIPAATSTTFAFRNTTKKGSVKNIKFIQKDWSTSLNGSRIDRFSSWENVNFSYFNGHGLVLESVDSLSRTCYGSTLKSITCDYNAKHGIVIGGTANAIIIENPTCRFNGAPSYGVAPSSLGLHDGIYSGGKNSEYPGTPGVFNDPQGCVIIGGDLSYNAREGLNLDRFFDGVVIGGYAEGNFGNDIKIRHMYGSNVVNFMAADFGDVDVVSPDPLNPNTSFNVSVYPNSIIIRGRSSGNGQKSSQAGIYDKPMDALRASGSEGSSKILPSSRGGILCQQNGGGGINWHFGDLPMYARKACIGDGYVDSSSSAVPYLSLKRLSDIEGSEALRLITAGQFLQMYVVSGGGASTTDTTMRVPKHSITGRSINAGGTVNTNGADYAEYMRKSPSCGDIKKGDIVGINSDGELTDKFSESISFVVKSTNPSFVGGDTWSAEEELGIKHPGDLTGEESDDEISEYNHKKELYESALEVARKSVDRVAFCGQVPVNVIDAMPGDYVVPVCADDDSISYLLTAKVTFEQYSISVGRMITKEKMIVKSL